MEWITTCRELRQESACKSKQRHNNKRHSFSIETDVVTRERTHAWFPLFVLEGLRGWRRVVSETPNLPWELYTGLQKKRPGGNFPPLFHTDERTEEIAQSRSLTSFLFFLWQNKSQVGHNPFHQELNIYLYIFYLLHCTVWVFSLQREGNTSGQSSLKYERVNSLCKINK